MKAFKATAIATLVAITFLAGWATSSAYSGDSSSGSYRLYVYPDGSTSVNPPKQEIPDGRPQFLSDGTPILYLDKRTTLPDGTPVIRLKLKELDFLGTRVTWIKDQCSNPVYGIRGVGSTEGD